MADMEVTVGMKTAEMERSLRGVEQKAANSARSIEGMFKLQIATKAFMTFGNFAMNAMRGVADESYEVQKALKTLDGSTGISAAIGRSVGFAVNNLDQFTVGAENAESAWGKWIDLIGKTPNGIFARMIFGGSVTDPAKYGDMVAYDKANARAAAAGKLGVAMKDQLATAEKRAEQEGAASEFEKRRIALRQQAQEQEKALLALSAKGVAVDRTRARYAELRAEAEGRINADEDMAMYTRFAADAEAQARQEEEDLVSWKKANADKEQALEDADMRRRGRSLSIEQLRTGDTLELASKKAILEYEQDLLDIKRQQNLTDQERLMLQAERSGQLGEELDALRSYYGRREMNKQNSYGSFSGGLLGEGQAATLRQVMGGAPAQRGQQAAQTAAVKSEAHLAKIATGVAEMARRAPVAVLG